MDKYFMCQFVPTFPCSFFLSFFLSTSINFVTLRILKENVAFHNDIFAVALEVLGDRMISELWYWKNV